MPAPKKPFAGFTRKESERDSPPEPEENPWKSKTPKEDEKPSEE